MRTALGTYGQAGRRRAGSVQQRHVRGGRHGDADRADRRLRRDRIHRRQVWPGVAALAGPTDGLHVPDLRRLRVRRPWRHRPHLRFQPVEVPPLYQG